MMNSMSLAYIRTFNKFCSANNIKRSYARWSHRKPLKVLLPEDEVKQFPEAEDVLKTDVLKTSYVPTQNPKTTPKKPDKQPDILKNVKSLNDEITYTKLKNHDPLIGPVLTLIKSKREKQKQNLILLEGYRIIKEALECGCKLNYLIFSQKEDLSKFEGFLKNSDAKIYKMPYREIQMWSDLTTSPGLMGLFTTPTTENNKSSSKLPLTVVCDNIREPGNLGAIIRTSAGVGCSRVLLTKGCVDLWDSKVIRSGSGGHFRIPIINKCTFDEVKEKIGESAEIFLADNLNQRKYRYTSETVGRIPIQAYYNTKFNMSNESVLIIGGETEGLSQEAYHLAGQRNGVRVNIPLENNVESLNSGTSLGIIAFEMKRQFETVTHDSPVNVETDVSLSLRYI